ncbi:DUF2637 domain-containing protein [Streptomyces sp. NPDC060048]|uniref:DUF2637 domain-containing protein n=2 Tax=Streptomyces TaxID=1883 RepID=UPI0036A449C5
MAAMQLTRTHRILIGVVVAGAVVIAGIGFAGSYSAVRALALQKGFGSFSLVFPIGIDAGICVLLALDLLLTWIRIPFPLLRQTAWLLTAATIAFNGAAAWPDPLGVGMHAVIPILFVVTVEAARHAVGRIADITADRHMEGVRITRWLLSPIPTFKLWRRMKLWELRSYEQAVGMEQDRLIYQARLQARYGRFWRRKAPVGALMPLRLARIGVPLSQTAPEGLAAAGIDPLLLPPAAAEVAGMTSPALPPGSRFPGGHGPAEVAGGVGVAAAPADGTVPAVSTVPAGSTAPADPGALAAAAPQAQLPAQSQAQSQAQAVGPAGEALPVGPQAAGPGMPEPVAHTHSGPHPGPQWEGEPGGPGPQGVHAAAPFAVDPTAMPAAHNSAWFAAPRAPQAAYEGGYSPHLVEGVEPTPVTPPTGPEAADQELAVPASRRGQESADAGFEAVPFDEVPFDEARFDEVKFAEAAYEVFRGYIEENNQVPTPEQVDIYLSDRHGIVHPRSASMIRRMMPDLKQRYQQDLQNEHIA